MIDNWHELTQAQRTALLDLMRASFEAAMEGSLAKANERLDAAGIPFTLEVKVVTKRVIAREGKHDAKAA